MTNNREEEEITKPHVTKKHMETYLIDYWKGKITELKFELRISEIVK